MLQTVGFDRRQPQSDGQPLRGARLLAAARIFRCMASERMSRRSSRGSEALARAMDSPRLLSSSGPARKIIDDAAENHSP